MIELTTGEIARYSRHIRLRQFGLGAQTKLKNATVLVIGAGGLGCPVIQYLAASGVGCIGVIDGDSVHESNLHRQILYGVASLGRPKVAVVRERVRDLNPLVQFVAFHEWLTVNNVERVFSSFDIIVDGSDNFETRYLVNDACVVMGKPFVSASIFEFEGQISTFNYKDSFGVLGPTYRCLFPSPPKATESPNCAENGVLGVLPGLMGLMQANEAIKIAAGVGDVLSGRLLIIDALRASYTTVSFTRQESVVARTKLEADYSAICGSNGSGVMMKNIQEITPRALKERLDAGDEIILIDVREPDEREICHIGGELIPMDKVPDSLARIPRDKPVVLYCRSGGRSSRVAQYLQKEHSYVNILNLSGGVLRWSDEVDSSIQKY